MAKIKSHIQHAMAYAPATSANSAVGFDILGFALQQLGDSVTLSPRNDEQLVITSTQDIPHDPQTNTASLAVRHLLDSLEIAQGFHIHIDKKIPISAGLGGSAASAVAALLAVNAFLDRPVERHRLAQYAIQAEAASSGTAHADNVIPCLYGGFTLIRGLQPLDVITLPLPALRCVLVHPDLRLETKKARAILKESYALKDVVKQSANLASFITALHTGDLNLLKRCMHDYLIEPQRAHLIPGFFKVKEAALQAGALGASLSGSGTSLFALVSQDDDTANAVRDAMLISFKKNGLSAQAWVMEMSQQGAHLIDIQ